MNRKTKTENCCRVVLEGNLVRYLPMVKLNDQITLAAFNSMGDTQLILKVGDNLNYQILEKIGYDEYANISCIITTECKGIPFAMRLGQLMGIDFVVLRKDKKIYLENPEEFEGESITSGKSKYYLSETDADKLKNSNVLIVDDVFSTGKTIDSILNVTNKLNCNVKGIAVAVTEGTENITTYKDLPLFSCGKLPIFKNNKERTK